MRPDSSSHFVKCYNMIFGTTFEREIWKRNSCGKTTHQGRAQSTVNPQHDSSMSLEGYRMDVLKKQTYTHIKVLQGSIIDHFTL